MTNSWSPITLGTEAVCLFLMLVVVVVLIVVLVLVLLLLLLLSEFFFNTMSRRLSARSFSCIRNWSCSSESGMHGSASIYSSMCVSFMMSVVDAAVD